MKVKKSEKPGLKLSIQKTKIMASDPITSWQMEEKVEIEADFIFLGSKITADGDYSYEIKTHLLLGRKVMTNLDSVLKSRHYFANKGLSSQSYGFSSSHVWMWELDHQVGRAQKNLNCGAVEDFDRLLDSKEIQPVHPRGNQSWIFIGRTDAEVEVPLFWPPDVKNWLIWKDPDSGKDWRQEEKGMTEDEMVGWHQRTNSMDLGLSKLQELVIDRKAWRDAGHGVTKSQTWLSDWTELWKGAQSFSKKKKIELPLPACLVTQACLNLGDPIDGNPPGSPVPGFL